MAKKKKRKLKKSVKLLLFLCIIIIGLIYLNNTTKDTDNITSNNDIKENKEIKEDKSNEETKEVDYDSLDTLGKLEYLSTKDKRINKIIDNYDKYPEILLQMLTRNSDMTSYMLDYPEKKEMYIKIISVKFKKANFLCYYSMIRTGVMAYMVITF